MQIFNHIRRLHSVVSTASEISTIQKRMRMSSITKKNLIRAIRLELI